MNYFKEFNQRFGEGIRDRVLRDVGQGKGVGPNKIRSLTVFLALLIVLTPYCVAVLGALIIGLNFDSAPIVAIGLIVIACGYYLWAPPLRNGEETLRPADAPTLFALVDEIARSLGAPAVDGIHVTGEFNAYMAEFSRKERVLGIGAPLWLSLDPAERLAILAHEVAHLINQDPARGRLTSGALQTLSRWHDLTRPPALYDHESRSSFYYEERGLIGQSLGFLFGRLISTMAAGFERLIFADSQRAEYLADIASSSVAGVSASNGALKKTILAPLADAALNRTYFDGSKDVSVFEDMAHAIRHPDRDQAEPLYADAIELGHSVDSSHPPTRYRMEVVAAAGSEKPTIDAEDVRWCLIDQELASILARREQELLSKIISQ